MAAGRDDGNVTKNDETEGILRRRFMSCAQQKIEQASELIKQKIPCAGHFLAPKRLWFRRVSTPNCDVVIVFPPGAQDSILLWLLSRLRQSSGMSVHVRHHASTQSSAFYVSAPFSVLVKIAEEYHLPKSLKASKGGGLKEISRQELQSFENSDNEQSFFTTEERQWLILRLLESIRAKPSDTSSVSGLSLPEGQSILPKCLTAGVISQVFPLHEATNLERLQYSWVRDIWSKQPLDDIREYFGVKIGMYFAWLGHYTTALSVPAAVGLLFWLCCNGKHQTLEDVGYVLFSIFNVVWATTYLQVWKRYSAELAFRWGTLDQRDDLLAEPRPLFRGPLHPSPVTGRPEPRQPALYRLVFKYCVSVPVIAFCLITVFFVMIVSLQIQFQFVNSFLSLFYIAFYLQDQVRLKEQLAALLISRQVIGNLKESALPYILEHMRLAKMSFDLWGALSPVNSRQPPGIERELNVSAGAKERDTQNQASARRSLSQAELESSLYKYDGTFADHLEMTIQLGYVILFSSAFPPAALCAMLNNLIEIRSDAFKLVYVCQRPFGQRVPNIGTWQNCMEYMSIMAVLVNCGLIGLSGQVHRMFPNMTATQTVLFIVALEHVMLCIRFIITCAIPELPGWLATEMARIEWARREASRLSTTATPSPDDASSKCIGRFSVSPSHSLVSASDVHDEKDKEHSIESSKNVPLSSATTSSSCTPTQHKPVFLSPDGIPEIPPFKHRKSKEYTPGEGEGRHHLTIGPSGGVEWARKIKEESDIHRSTDCITHKDASSSDSDLLRGSLVWPPRPRSPSGSGSVIAANKTLPVPTDASLSDGAHSISKETEDQAAKAAADELVAKKTRVKQTLMKRARSVAIFSLKLKERRAREAQEREKADKPSVPPTSSPLHPPQCGGGELSCIPIEMLIQLEDLKRNQKPTQGGTL